MAFSLSRSRSLSDPKPKASDQASRKKCSSNGEVPRSPSPTARKPSATVHPLASSCPNTPTTAPPGPKRSILTRVKDGIHSGTTNKALTDVTHSSTSIATAHSAQHRLDSLQTGTTQAEDPTVSGREPKARNRTSAGSADSLEGLARREGVYGKPENVPGAAQDEPFLSRLNKTGQSGTLSGFQNEDISRTKERGIPRSDSSSSSGSSSGYGTASDSSSGRQSHHRPKASGEGGSSGSRVRAAARQNASMRKGVGTKGDDSSDLTHTGDSHAPVSSRGPSGGSHLLSSTSGQQSASTEMASQTRSSKRSGRLEPRRDHEAELTALRDQLAESERAQLAQAEESERLRAELQESKAQREVLEGRARSSGQENATLRQHCKALKGKTDQLTSALASAQSENSVLRTTMEGFERESKNLKRSLAAASSEQAALNQTLTRVYLDQERLGKALKRTSRQLDCTKDELRIALEELDLLRPLQANGDAEQSEEDEADSRLCHKCRQALLGGTENKDEAEQRVKLDSTPGSSVTLSENQPEAAPEIYCPDALNSNSEAQVTLTEENRWLRGEVEELRRKLGCLEQSLTQSGDPQARCAVELRRELEECVKDIECMKEEFSVEREGLLTTLRDCAMERDKVQRQLETLEAELATLLEGRETRADMDDTRAGAHVEDSMLLRRGFRGEDVTSGQEEATEGEQEKEAEAQEVSCIEAVEAPETAVEELSREEKPDLHQHHVGHLQASLSKPPWPVFQLLETDEPASPPASPPPQRRAAPPTFFSSIPHLPLSPCSLAPTHPPPLALSNSA